MSTSDRQQDEAANHPTVEEATEPPSDGGAALRSVILSDRQKTTVGAAITVLSAFVIICAVAALLWLVGAFFSKFSGVFLPLAVAGITPHGVHHVGSVPPAFDHVGQ